MAKYRKKAVEFEATQWFKNGDHPDDAIEQLRASGGEPFDSEGKVVRYYRYQRGAVSVTWTPRRPECDGQEACKHCGTIMHLHGWIETLEGGHIVCPADHIITGTKGEHYPCKPDIFPGICDPIDD
jgi:hypothetical protein